MLKMKFAYLKVLNKPAHAHKQTQTLVHTHTCSQHLRGFNCVCERDGERECKKCSIVFSACRELPLLFAAFIVAPAAAVVASALLLHACFLLT